jgi:predicted phosphate transport protein (TIGR00153 family)
MFSSSNVTIWLSRREEKKILKLCQSHFEKIIDTVKGMKNVIYTFCDEDFDEQEKHYTTTFESERAADAIKRQILAEISTGPLHPIDREEVIRLVLTADDIAENAKSAARKLRLASTKCLTEEIAAHLKEIADMCVEIVERVWTAFLKLGEKKEQAIEAANQVEALEEMIDEHRLGLVKRILNCKERIISIKSLGPWLMLMNAIENMEDLADRSEDVADVIRSIAILR